MIISNFKMYQFEAYLHLYVYYSDIVVQIEILMRIE